MEIFLSFTNFGYIYRSKKQLDSYFVDTPGHWCTTSQILCIAALVIPECPWHDCQGTDMCSEAIDRKARVRKSSILPRHQF